MKKLLLVALLFVSAVCGAHAQQVIKVGSTEGTQPYYPAITAVYKEIGLTPEFVALPSERSLKSVEGGQVDADVARVSGGIKGYQNMVETNESLMELRLLAVVKKDFKAAKLAPPDLKSYKLGLVRGTKMAEGLVQAIGAEANVANDTKGLLTMLSNDRFEVALLPHSYPLSAHPEFASTLITLQQPIITSKVVHIFNTKWASYVPKFDAAVKAMKADGRWGKLTTPP